MQFKKKKATMVGNWRKEYLDMVLVPTGLLLMFTYHLFLLYRYLKHPQTTDIGYDNHNKRIWVQRIMLIEAADRGQAISMINSNMSAATSLCSISLVLSSLMGAWIGTSSMNVFTSGLVYGDTTHFTISLKYISLLFCFLVAFASFVQSIRCFVRANFLICMPESEVPVSYVEEAVISGGNFWSFGLRSLYFATTLLIWMFGPIPMFLSAVVMVAVLYPLDKNSTPLHGYQPTVARTRFPEMSRERSTPPSMTTENNLPDKSLVEI